MSCSMVLLSISLGEWVLTLIVGVLASAIAWVIIDRLTRKKKYHLCIKRKQSQLYLAQNAGDVTISVKYKSKEVNTTLVFFQLVLENDGSQGIKYDQHFSDAIRIHSEVLDFISVEAEKSLSKASCELDEDGNALLSWDILKSKEQIVLNIFAETNFNYYGELSPDLMFKSLSFELRADCLESIDTEKEPLYSLPSIIEDHLPTYVVAILAIIGLSMNVLFQNVKFNQSELFPGNNNEVSLLYSGLLNKYIARDGNYHINILSPESMPSTIELMIPKRDSYQRVLGMSVEVLSIVGVLYIIYLFITSIIRRRREWKLRQKEYPMQVKQ